VRLGRDGSSPIVERLDKRMMRYHTFISSKLRSAGNAICHSSAVVSGVVACVDVESGMRHNPDFNRKRPWNRSFELNVGIR
jgi:hypothetical protein